MKTLIINNNIVNYLLGVVIFSLLFSVIMDRNISFFLFVLLIIFFIFFNTILEISIFSLLIFLVVFSFNFLNFYKIEEKNNIFIPNQLNQIKYLKYINKDDYSMLKKEFNYTYDVKKNICKINDPTCWKKLNVDDGISYNINILFKNENYSRLISNINHNSLATIRINEVNKLNLNFYEKNIFTRNELPYFVNYKFPKFLDNSEICFKGKLILDKKYIHQKDKKCIKVNYQKSYLFYNFNYLEITLKKNIKSLIIEYFLLFLNIFVIFNLFKNSKFNKKEFLYKISIIIISVAGFIYFFYRRDDFIFGYHSLSGGMDGLLHESFAKEIFISLKSGNIISALRGQEDVYYFMPGMRYFLFLEKLIFGNNFYLIYALMIFIPLILYSYLKIFFKTNFSYIVSVLFLFLNIPQLGFGASIYYKSLLTAYPEGVLFFFLILSLIFNHNKSYFIAGLFLAFAVFMRPNFLPFALMFLMAQCFILFYKNEINRLTKLILGISFILLIPLHNYSFKTDNFYFLTSSKDITSNKVLTFTDYANTISNKKISEHVVNHLKNVINTGIDKKHVFIINLLLFINLIISFVVLFKKFSPEEKIFLSCTIFQICPSFFYVNTGRFAIVVWFLILISNLIILKYFFQKNNI